MATASYDVVKEANRRWFVLKNGERMKHDGCYYARSFSTKRDALAHCEEDAAYDARIARETDDDVTGVYRWTESEEKQISEYAVVLRENAERYSMYGKNTAQNLARLQHEKDADDIDPERRYMWTDPDRVGREKRRVMAARAEAFKAKQT